MEVELNNNITQLWRASWDTPSKPGIAELKTWTKIVHLSLSPSLLWLLFYNHVYYSHHPKLELKPIRRQLGDSETAIRTCLDCGLMAWSPPPPQSHAAPPQKHQPPVPPFLLHCTSGSCWQQDNHSAIIHGYPCFCCFQLVHQHQITVKEDPWLRVLEYNWPELIFFPTPANIAFTANFSYTGHEKQNVHSGKYDSYIGKCWSLPSIFISISITPTSNYLRLKKT